MLTRDKAQRILAVCFGIFFLYLIIGVFLKQQIGSWLAAIWYIMGMAIVAFIAYVYISKKKDRKPKIIEAQYKTL